MLPLPSSLWIISPDILFEWVNLGKQDAVQIMFHCELKQFNHFLSLTVLSIFITYIYYCSLRHNSHHRRNQHLTNGHGCFFLPQPSQLDLWCLRWEGRGHSPGVSPRPFWQQIELPLNSEVLGAAHRPKGNAVMKTSNLSVLLHQKQFTFMCLISHSPSYKSRDGNAQSTSVLPVI